MVVFVLVVRLVNHLTTDEHQQAQSNPWRELREEIGKERAREIAYQRHSALEQAEEQCHQHRLGREASTMLLPRAHHATRCQSFRDRHRKAIHRQTDSNQYDRENIHREIYKLRFTHKYENYVKNENNANTPQEALSFRLVARSGFALRDIAEFVLAELATDGRDTVGEDMRFKVVVFVQDNTRGKIR